MSTLVVLSDSGADSFLQGPFDDEVLNPEPNEASPVSPVSSESDQSFLSMVDSITSIPGNIACYSHDRQPLPPGPASITTGAAPLLDQPRGTRRRDTTSTGRQSPRLNRSVLTPRRRPSVDDGYESRVPKGEAASEKQNESGYRHDLVHPYHTSLNLPRT